MGAYMAANKELNFLNPESQKIFRDMVENIKVGAFMADSYHNLFYVNHTFCDTLNLTNSTHVLGKNWTEILCPNPEQRKQCFATLSTKGFITDLETTHVILDQKVTLLITAHHIRNDQGHVIGTRGVFFNISEKLKLEDEIRHEHKRLEQLVNFHQGLGSMSQLNELTGYIVKETSHILNVERCSLIFLDPLLNELYVKDSCGIPEEFLHNTRIKVGEPIAGILILQSQPMLVNDIESHELFHRHKRKSYHQSSFMSVPLIYEQRLLGLLNVADRQGGFKPIDLKVLETLSQQSTVSINKILTLNKYQLLAETDPKTGLLNFRSFTLKLNDEIQRATRYTLPLSLMMIDVDNFKAYNDTHGHPKGDQLLKSLAEIFHAQVRSTETICRYGGDEFSIILPNTNCVEAAIVGEKLRETVSKKFSQDKISLSIGVTQFQSVTTKEMFVKHADEALYQSKKNGRNRVSFSKISV